MPPASACTPPPRWRGWRWCCAVSHSWKSPSGWRVHWLALGSWRAAARPAPEPDAQAGANAVRDGFLIAFLNPKVALFFLALFSQFVSAEMAMAARVQVAATAVVIDAAWYSLVALLLARGPVLAALRRHHDKVERATAVVLVLVAAAVWL